MAKLIIKGARVKITGYGRTAKWPKSTKGTVTKRRADSVFVKWDGTSFEDQMNIREVKLLNTVTKKKRKS